MSAVQALRHFLFPMAPAILTATKTTTKSSTSADPSLYNEDRVRDNEFSEDEEEDYVSALQQSKEMKNWTENAFIPLAAVGAAGCLMMYLAYATRKTGRPLNQRLMEGRVGAQATLLAGVIGLGIYHWYTGEKQKQQQQQQQLNFKPGHN